LLMVMLPSSPGRRLPPAPHPVRRATPARIDTPPGTAQTPGRFRRSCQPGPAPRDAASGNGTRPAPGDAKDAGRHDSAPPSGRAGPRSGVLPRRWGRAGRGCRRRTRAGRWRGSAPAERTGLAGTKWRPGTGRPARGPWYRSGTGRRKVGGAGPRQLCPPAGVHISNSTNRLSQAGAHPAVSYQQGVQQCPSSSSASVRPRRTTP